MEALGAELKDGKWYYDGQPVTLIGLVRADLPSCIPKLDTTSAVCWKTLALPLKSRSSPVAKPTRSGPGLIPRTVSGASTPAAGLPRPFRGIPLHTFDQFYTHRVMPYAGFHHPARHS